MAKRLEVYKCMICGNIVEILDGADGVIFCCGEPMKKLLENTVDATKEKHVPVIERIEGGYKVKVGSIAHPMEQKHYIEWVELLSDGRSYIQFLKPGDTPEAVFKIESNNVSAREHCNLHGLWKGEKI